MDQECQEDIYQEDSQDQEEEADHQEVEDHQEAEDHQEEDHYQIPAGLLARNHKSSQEIILKLRNSSPNGI